MKVSIDADYRRVIAYFDVDCFYAQAEELKRPHLQGRPVGVTQKFLVVTCNYEARQRGVPKMASIQTAKERCPDLILFNGEDLTPYRAASKTIMMVLSRFGVLERRGLDEAALDITAEVMKRSTLMQNQQEFSGHVLGLADLNGNCGDFSLDPYGSDHFLMVGSQLVSEIRAAVEREAGFRCSSGIATNKMLAKLVSSVNKPNQQTCILGSAVDGFLSPLSVRKLPGIGHQTELVLKDMGILTVANLRNCTLEDLIAKFGSRLGTILFDNCRGKDDSLVQDKGPPKSLSVEDSFQPCTTYKQAEGILRSLAPDLISRLDEDKDEFSRIPKLFSIKWRYPGNWAFRSSSGMMPIEIISPSISMEKRLETVVDTSMKLLSQSLGRQSFSIVVLNIGATNFMASSSGSIGASHDIRSYLNGPTQSPHPKLWKVVSKREARINREQTEKGGLASKLSKPIFKSNDEDIVSQDHDAMLIHQGLAVPDDFPNFLCEEDGCSWKCDGLCSPKMQPCPIMRGPQTGNAMSSILSDKDYTLMDASEHFVRDSPAIDDLSVDVDTKRLVAERNDHRVTPATDSQIYYYNIDEFPVQDLQFGSFICDLCGQEVQGDPQSRQEHDDYEYALKLNSQEQQCAALMTKMHPQSKQLSVKTSLHLKSPHKRAKTQTGKKTRQSVTMDCFVFRS